MIVDEKRPVTLIGGAEVTETTLSRARALAPVVVAADGGADAALINHTIPQAVIGDFDSLSDWARGQLPDCALHPIPDQDSTDFDKCLSNIRAPLIIGVGFSGARLDHQLAAYNTMVRHPHRRCILLGTEELVFLAPPELRMDVPKDCAVSLFPFGAVEGQSDGLKYPIGGLNFAPDGRVGTSNHATGPISLSVTAPKMLVILPQAMLEIAAEALMNARAQWPQG